MEIKIHGIARYVHILQPSAPKDTTSLKYSTQVLIKKTDPEVKKLQEMISELTLSGFPNGIPPKFFTFFSDLAVEEPENKELADYMCLKANSNVEFERPCLVDHEFKPIIDVHAPVEGKLIWLSGSICTYDKVSKGIRVNLKGVMVTKEMGDIPLENLSSKPTPEQMFQGCAVSSETKPVSNSVSSPTPPPPAPPVPEEEASYYIMTDKANGMSRDSFVKNGWTDEQLMENGYMSSKH